MKRILVLAIFLISAMKFAMERDWLYLVLTGTALALLLFDRSGSGGRSRSAISIHGPASPKRKA